MIQTKVEKKENHILVSNFDGDRRVSGGSVGFVQAHLNGAKIPALTIGGVELDDRTKSVLVDGEQVALTPTEYAILHLLMSNPGKVYSTKALYEAVWREAALGSEGAVAVHIRHLREKIEINPSEPRYLKVVWGQGYKMEGGK